MASSPFETLTHDQVVALGEARDLILAYATSATAYDTQLEQFWRRIGGLPTDEQHTAAIVALVHALVMVGRTLAVGDTVLTVPEALDCAYTTLATITIDA